MLLFQDRSRPHQFLSAILWTLAAVATLLAGAMALLTSIIALSLDFGETLAAGSEPWVAALVAILEFLGIAAACGGGLLAWHTQRWKVAGLVLIALAVLATLWLGVRFVGEYT